MSTQINLSTSQLERIAALGISADDIAFIWGQYPEVSFENAIKLTQRFKRTDMSQAPHKREGEQGLHSVDYKVATGQERASDEAPEKYEVSSEGMPDLSKPLVGSNAPATQPLGENILKVLGDEERAELAVAHVMEKGNCNRDVAIGTLETMCQGKGQLNDYRIEGIAEAFPEIAALFTTPQAPAPEAPAEGEQGQADSNLPKDPTPAT